MGTVAPVSTPVGNDQMLGIASVRPIAVRRFGPLIALALFLALPALPGRADDKAPAGSRNTLFLTGQLLVASPDIADPKFTETVIYVVTHHPDGAVLDNPAALGRPATRRGAPISVVRPSLEQFD